jgi:DNA polymerase-3 subunit beta
LSGNVVEWDTDGDHITSILSGASFFKIIGIADEEFPPLPTFSGDNSFGLEQGVLKEMLRNTRYAASNDETRYMLNGVLMSFNDEKLTVVATDGRRLALLEQEVEFPKSAEVDLVIPGKTADELIKNLRDEGSVKIQASVNQISFEFENLLIVSKLIEGTYPNFQQVIPSQCEERVSVERESLFTAVRRVSLLANDKSNSIRLSFLPNQLEVSAVTPQVGEALETIPVKYTGKKISIAFNPEFLLDPLRNITSDEIAFEMTDDLSPGVLKCDLPFLYVLMPMRIN